MKLSSETKRWFLQTTVHAVVVLAVGATLIAMVGVAQRIGWIRGGSESGGGTSVAEVAADTRYICPMMCVPPSSEPGKCPVCAMDLVPATSGGGSGDEKSVSFDPAARRLAGIETVSVAAVPASESLTAVGELEVDQAREATLSAYVGGRLERLYADSVGVRVQKGQKLVELYSPDLYTAQQEYLAAIKNAASGPLAGDGLTGELRRIAREKLVELGLSDAQIDAVRDAGRAAPRVSVPAPIGGTVTHKPLKEGDYVAVGQPIYHIADLSTVWLRLELFPEQAARVREGQPVTARVDSLPSRTFAGSVLLVEPTVDSETRTVGVRVELPNPDGSLRPGDYATAKLELPVTPEVEGPLVSVPADAVLRAGGGSVVYVETEPGRFEIRTIALGPAIGGSVVVTEGLSEGESVALRGNFLIDSQMQLAGNPSLLDTTKLNAVTEPGEPVFPDGPLPLEGAPKLIAGKTGEQLDRVFEAYFAVRDRLASDAMPDVDDAMTLLTDAATAAADESLPKVARRHLKITSEAADRLFEEDIDTVRDGFRRISHGLLPVASRVRGPKTAETLTHFYCPMVEGGGGDWLQAGALDTDALRNPYWGSRMLTCGRKVRELETASAAGEEVVR